VKPTNSSEAVRETNQLPHDSSEAVREKPTNSSEAVRETNQLFRSSA
jgi:hypothetical protein